MIIVSQDKEEIINFNNVCHVYIDRAAESEEGRVPIELESINDSFITIGFYNSVERAKEVLNEIVNEYSSYLEIKGGPAILKGSMDIQPNVFNIPKVFEMPEK